MDPVLRILFTPIDDTTYETHVTVSPSGITPSGTFETPREFRGRDLELLRDLLAHWRNQDRPRPSVKFNAPSEIGGALFRALFTGPIHNAFIIGREAARAAGQPLQLQLQFSSASQLAELPWEFLCDPSEDVPLAKSHEVAIVRYLPLQKRRSSQPLKLPLRVLVMAAAPEKTADGTRLFAPINVEKELEALSSSFRELETAGTVKIIKAQGTTPEDFKTALSSGQFHAFHFIGHGDPGVVYFADDARIAIPISADDLADQLNKRGQLRLVVLNNCEGSKGSKWNVYSGVAQTLVESGVPTVVGMQVPITDDAAIRFSTSFYQGLARYETIDDAVDDGRRALEKNYSEWATPTLYCESRTPFVPPPPPFTSALIAARLGGLVEFLRLALPYEDPFTLAWGTLSAGTAAAAAALLVADLYRNSFNLRVPLGMSRALTSGELIAAVVMTSAVAAALFIALRRLSWVRRISLTKSEFFSLGRFTVFAAILAGAIWWYTAIPPTIEILVCPGELPSALKSSAWSQQIPYSLDNYATVEPVHQQVHWFVAEDYPDPNDLRVRIAPEPQSLIDFNRIYTAADSAREKSGACTSGSLPCTIRSLTVAGGRHTLVFDLMSSVDGKVREANLLNVTTTIQIVDANSRMLAEQSLNRRPYFDAVPGTADPRCVPLK